MEYYIKCKDVNLGRACTQACLIYKNKHYGSTKIIFVGPINVKEKIYYKHTGRNMHEYSGIQLKDRRPLYLIRRTIQSMLPKNTSSLKFLKSIEYKNE